jgi:transcriptional regulator GlxA family with amidase domain
MGSSSFALVAGLPLLLLGGSQSPEPVRIRSVAIFVYQGVELLDFAGPSEVFQATRSGGGRCFAVHTVAETKEPVISQGFLEIRPQYSIEDCPQPDVLVVPGGNVPLARARVVEWVKRVAPQTELTFSVCNGALLLARAGVLDGLEATTHHGSLESLSLSAPGIRVLPGRRFVDNGRVLTAAGVSAGIDGALHAVERLVGRQAAAQTAYYMEYRWEPAAAEAYQERMFGRALPAAPEVPAGTTWVCPPCGGDCHAKKYERRGVCDGCGMVLAPEPPAPRGS